MKSTDTIQVGDRVYVNSGLEPKLYFVVEEIDELHGSKMACGDYGCFAVDLLVKVSTEK